jgi:hypothetical protein
MSINRWLPIVVGGTSVPLDSVADHHASRTAEWSGTWQVAYNLHAIPSGTTRKASSPISMTLRPYCARRFHSPSVVRAKSVVAILQQLFGVIPEAEAISRTL